MMSMFVMIHSNFDVFREPGLDHERGFWKLQSRDVSIVLDDDEAEEVAKKLRKRAKDRTKEQCVSVSFSGVGISLVVFDPPHISRDSSTGIIAKKYGKLRKEWREDVRNGFQECLRVLRPGGFLNFKWSEAEIPLAEVTPLFPIRPMYYQRQGIHGA